MIRLHGSRQLTFKFPADRPTTFAFYRTSIEELVRFLPHIELVKRFASDHALLAYQARELATYDIQMVCEVGLEFDRPDWTIRIVTRENGVRVKPSASMTHSLGWGWYQSESRLETAPTTNSEPADQQTLVHFKLDLSGELPTPTTMRLMPDRAVNRIANAITGQRIEEIAHGFIERSIAACLAREHR